MNPDPILVKYRDIAFWSLATIWLPNVVVRVLSSQAPNSEVQEIVKAIIIPISILTFIAACIGMFVRWIRSPYPLCLLDKDTATVGWYERFWKQFGAPDKESAFVQARYFGSLFWIVTITTIFLCRESWWPNFMPISVGEARVTLLYLLLTGFGLVTVLQHANRLPKSPGIIFALPGTILLITADLVVVVTGFAVVAGVAALAVKLVGKIP